MEKIKFEYEIELSDEVQDRYNEMAQDSALPIVIKSLLNALRETELDVEKIINGFHAVWKHKGKSGLRQMVPLVDELYRLKVIDINHQGNEAIDKVKKQLKNF